MNWRFGSLAIVTILLSLSKVASANPVDSKGDEFFKPYGVRGAIDSPAVIFSPYYSGYGDVIPNGVYPPNYEIVPNGFVIDYDRLEDPTQQFVEPSPRVTYINPLFVRTEVARQIFNPLGVVSLDPTLLEATCKQDWRTALQIIDRTIAQTPENQSSYRTELQNYRKRLQTLANTRSTRTNPTC
jgi:hypothetical protein